MDEKIIFINGFTETEAVEIMRAVKKTIKNPDETAFCMGTENNLEWKVRDLISHVCEEHRQMKNQK